MSHMSWNKFMSEHKNIIGFSANVSSRLPKPVFDRNTKKKLPTPYGLFTEWAKCNLTGDWSATAAKGGFVICVVSADDISKIKNEFGSSNYPSKTDMCDKTYPMHYSDRSYGDLAKKLGYKIA